MTCNVFGGTLNLAQSVYQIAAICGFLMKVKHSGQGAAGNERYISTVGNYIAVTQIYAYISDCLSFIVKSDC